MRIFIISCFILIFSASCGEDSSSPIVVLPTDLAVDIVQLEDNPDHIEVIATAEKVNFFRFDFGDGSEYVQQTGGTISYDYKASGEYTLLVTAHVTAVDYISKNLSVVVPEPDPADIIPQSGYSTPLAYEGMTMIWQDEFEEETLNTANWKYEIGIGSSGWGNNELQYYTDQNTSILSGNLIIEAREENKEGQRYTSSRIITQDRHEFTYGRIDIRAVLPEGQGIWPALWMLGTNITTVGWPACGEIDIMEMVGGGVGRDNTVYGTIHWSDNGAYASYGADYALSEGIFSDKFHVFSVIWDDQSIKWYVDDVLFNEVDTTPDGLSEFHQEFFFIFNVAVGGNWPGSPNESTTFPQRMIVDYIRVFQPN